MQIKTQKKKYMHRLNSVLCVVKTYITINLKKYIYNREPKMAT